MPPFEEEQRRLGAENQRLRAEREILKNATAFFAGGVVVRHRAIQVQSERRPVRLIRDVLGISPGGFSGWRGRPPSDAQRRREALVAVIETIHREVESCYGSPRIHAELLDRGASCSVNSPRRRGEGPGAPQFRITIAPWTLRAGGADRAWTPTSPLSRREKFGCT